MGLIKISQRRQEREMDRARYSGLKQENLQMQMRCNVLEDFLHLQIPRWSRSGDIALRRARSPPCNSVTHFLIKPTSRGSGSQTVEAGESAPG